MLEARSTPRRRKEAADEPAPHLGLRRLDRGRLDHAPPHLDRAAGGLAAARCAGGSAARPEVRHGRPSPACWRSASRPSSSSRGSTGPIPRWARSRPGRPHRDRPDGRLSVEPPPALDLRRPGFGQPRRPRTPLRLRFEPLVGYLPGVWLSGSLATLALIATGLVGVEGLRRSSRPLEADAIARRCRVLADSLGVARRVGVAICDRIAAPCWSGSCGR